MPESSRHDGSRRRPIPLVDSLFQMPRAASPSLKALDGAPPSGVPRPPRDENGPRLGAGALRCGHLDRSDRQRGRARAARSRAAHRHPLRRLRRLLARKLRARRREASPSGRAARRSAAELLQSFTVVNIVGTLGFSVTLPRLARRLADDRERSRGRRRLHPRDARRALRARPRSEQRARDERRRQRGARDLAPEHARQHPRRRRAAARRLDPRRRLDPARERQARARSARSAGATRSSRRATGRRSSSPTSRSSATTS